MVNDNRYITRKIAHAIEHIESGSYKLAISLLESAIKEDKDRIREGDSNGKRTDSST